MIASDTVHPTGRHGRQQRRADVMPEVRGDQSGHFGPEHPGLDIGRGCTALVEHPDVEKVVVTGFGGVAEGVAVHGAAADAEGGLRIRDRRRKQDDVWARRDRPGVRFTAVADEVAEVDVRGQAEHVAVDDRPQVRHHPDPCGRPSRIEESSTIRREAQPFVPNLAANEIAECHGKIDEC
ncbi:MAG TPA: hypothetical protein VFV67_36675 [Actinophytocola sp.]|uniref:hypothetical protein n=1 Tax=Actinophytocola sp. TaxID=1872138 RepID=UPI002DBE38C0|nr:hypothetical protein [Actinophytocola sp.]HEU5476192.1 hypothetical protein [Actinophytocola sp.]